MKEESNGGKWKKEKESARAIERGINLRETLNEEAYTSHSDSNHRAVQVSCGCVSNFTGTRDKTFTYI